MLQCIYFVSTERDVSTAGYVFCDKCGSGKHHSLNEKFAFNVQANEKSRSLRLS